MSDIGTAAVILMLCVMLFYMLLGYARLLESVFLLALDNC